MEIVWIGIGFLVGMSLWMPFLVAAKLESRLPGLEDRIATRVIEAVRRDRDLTR